MSDTLRWLSAHLLSWSTDVTSTVKLLICITLMLLVVAAITRFWPRTSAAQRHLLWSAVCGSILLAPIFQRLVPSYEVRVLPVIEQVSTPAYAPPTHAVVPLVTRPSDKTPAGDLSSATVRKPAPPASSPTTPMRVIPWMRVVGVLWGLGTLFVLMALLRSRRHVNALVATALPLDDPRIRGLVATLAAATGRRSRIEIKTHPSVVPMVCGIFRPVIILPEQALTWTETRLRHVLLHEMAHITRHDMLTQAIASLAVAVYWFHPLVWFAARVLRREREHACDDMVLAIGRRPAMYATDLLDLTGTFTQSRAISLTALPFARPSHMRDRLHAVLDTTRYRMGVSRRVTIIAWGAILGLVALAVGMTLQSVSTAEAQVFGPRPWYESPVTVAPVVLTAGGDHPTSLTFVIENQTDSVTISTPTLGFMRTDTDMAGNLVTEIGSPVSRTDVPTAMTWIQGLPDTVILQPHQRRLVAFTVTPPHNLANGVYYATINIPQANRKRVTWKDVKDWNTEGVLPGDKQQAPTVLVLIRHRAPETRVHLDSLALTGARACFRMWTENGIPYVGRIHIGLHTPWVKVSKSSSRAAGLATQDRPIALYGISSPKRFCTPLIAVPDDSPNQSQWLNVLFYHRRITPSTFSGPATLSVGLNAWWESGGQSNERIKSIPNEPEPSGSTWGEVSVYVQPRALTPR